VPDVDVTNLRLPRTWVTAQPNNPAFDISADELDDDIRAIGDVDWGNNSLLDVKTLEINNVAGTFQYVITGSAIIADRVATLPLLTGADTFVFEAFIQTLTNKTITLGGNTITGTTAEFDTALTGDNFAFQSDITGFFDTAGTGLTSTGSTVNVIGTASRIDANANDIDISASYVGQASITTLGTIATGTWQGDVVASAFLDADTMHLSVAQTVTGKKIFGAPAAVGDFALAGTTSGSTVLDATAVASGIMTLPAATDTLVARATTDTLTNKTYDSDGTGNVLTNVGSSEIKSEIITGFSTVTAVSGDFLLFSDTTDSGNLKKVDALDFLAGGEVFTWTANHDAAGFNLLNLNELEIENIASDGNNYTITGSAIVADRIATLPLLTGGDTFVFEAHTQTLTNKTIDGDDNTIVDINETQMNVSVGAATTVLTSNGVGSAPTYAAPAGGEFTAAWTADHNQGGSAFGLRDALFVDPTVTTKKLQIDLAGMTAAVTAILDFNFTTAKTITFPDTTGTVALTSDLTGFFDTAGTGLTSTGSTVNVIGTASRIVANANDIDIDSAYVGQTSLTTLGTIGTGTWEGTAVASAFLDADTMHLSIAQTVTGDKIFQDNVLFIQNPATTFEYQIVAAAIGADRVLTLPLLTGPDTMVTEAFTQTLTNKTIDGDDNTIVDINETQMNVSVGAATTVLTSNGVGSAPTYAAPAGGEFTAAWTADHNQGGSAFGLRDALFVDPTVTTKKIQMDLVGMTAAVTAILDFNFTTAKTLTFPDATDTLVGKATTDIFTNKSLDANGTGNVITNIGDAETEIFTTTKISTTNKSLLNSAIVYNDQVNTFGDFAQTFDDNQFFIRNPADTFSYRFIAAAITVANRDITLPLLTGNDTMVTEAFAQTLTNKTINTASNTLTVVAADMTDYASATAAFTNKSIDADGTGNVLTNIGSSEIKSEIITGQATVTAISGDFLLFSDTTDSGNLKKVDALDFLGGASQTPWASTIDAADFSLQNLDILDFNTVTDTPVNAAAQIWWNTASSMFFNVPTGDTFDFTANGVSQLLISETQIDFQANTLIDGIVNSTITGVSGITGLGIQAQALDMAANNILLNNNTFIEWAGVTERTIRNDTGGFQFRVEASDTTQFIFAGTNEATISETGITLTAGNNFITQASGASGFLQMAEITDPAGGTNSGKFYTKDVGGITRPFYIGDGLAATDLSTGAEIFTWTANHDAAGFNLLNLNELEIENIAGDFQYTFTGAAIVADRIITLPLLTAGDIMVTEAFTQTLTNKTMDGDLNTFVDINETQMNVSVGASTTVLTSNGVGAAPTYQAPAGGEFTAAWTANHNNTGSAFALEDAKFADPTDDTKTVQMDLSGNTTAIELTIATLQSTAQTVQIPNTTGLDQFVLEDFAQTLTTKTMDADNNTFSNFEIGNEVEATLLATLNFVDNDMTTKPAGNTNAFELLTEVTAGDDSSANPMFSINCRRDTPAAITNRVIFEIANNGIGVVQVDNAGDWEFFNHELAIGTGSLSFTIGQTITGAVAAIEYEVAAIDFHRFTFGGVLKYEMSNTAFSVGAQILEFSEANQDIIGSGTGIIYDTPASDTHSFHVAAAAQLTIGAATIDIHGNTITNTGILTLPTDTDTLVGRQTTDTFTNKTYDADGTGNVLTNVGSSEIKSEIITGQSTVTAISGDFILFSDTTDSGNLKKADVVDFLGGGEFTAAWTADHNQAGSGFALQDARFADPTDATKEIRLTLDGMTTGIVLTLDTNQTTAQTLTIPNTTGADDFVLEDFAQTLTNKTIAAGSNTISGLSIDGTEVGRTVTGGNLILTSNALEFNTGETISVQTSDMIFDVTTGDFFSFDIAGVPEVTISNTQMDLTGMNLVNAVMTGTVTGASAITGVGTIASGTWEGSVVASAFLDADTMHLSVAQVVTATKTFADNALLIQNPAADGNDYLFQSAAIVADRTITLPLLAGNDTMVTEAFGQTLTTKTLDADNNTVSNIGFAEVKNDLITGASTVTAISGDFVLFSDTTDSGNLKKADVADFLGGGEVFTWTADHDSDGFNLVFDTDANSGFIGDRDALVADNEIGVALGSLASLDYLFTETALDFQSNDAIDIQNTLMDADTTHLLDLTRTTAQADIYTIGEIRFRHPDAGAVLEDYANITGVMENDNVTNEEGSLHFFVTQNGNHDVERMSLNDAGNNALALTVDDVTQTVINNVPRYRFYTDRTTPVPSGIGTIEFAGDSDAASNLVFSEIQANTDVVIHASRSGSLRVRVLESGTLTDYVIFGGVGEECQFFKDVVMNGSAVQLRTDGNDSGDSFFGESGRR